MLSILIDLILVSIIGLCAWRGYRNGIIRGVLGILALVVAIYGGAVLASAYSGEVSTMLRPFVIGVVDSSVSDVMNTRTEANGGQETENAAAEDIVLTDEEKKDVYTVSFTTLKQLGLAEKAAEFIAEKTSEVSSLVGLEMSVNLTKMLCSALGYAVVFGIAFALIAIIFVVIGNLVNLTFAIPGIAQIDAFAGLALGIVKGVVVVLALAALSRYLGILVPESILMKTTLLKWLINENMLAGILGI